MPLSEDLRRPKRFLPASLLLLLAEGAGHGYELAERLAPFHIDVDDPTHVYRALRTLESEQLVASRWVTGQPGPARRVYEITPAGQEALERCARSLEELLVSADHYLSRFRELQAGGG